VNFQACSFNHSDISVRVRQKGRLRAPHELVDRALDQARRDRRHVPLVLTTWRSLSSLPPPLSLRERARFACSRRKAPHRVPQRRGGGGFYAVARHFQSILDESGRSAAWLAHLPWVKSRPNRGRLFRVIRKFLREFERLATGDSPRITPRHRCTPPKVPRRVPHVLEQWKALCSRQSRRQPNIPIRVAFRTTFDVQPCGSSCVRASVSAW